MNANEKLSALYKLEAISAKSVGWRSVSFALAILSLALLECGVFWNTLDARKRDLVRKALITTCDAPRYLPPD